MSAATTPKCLRCGRRKSVQRVGEHLLHCTKCGCRFDDDPAEGGDYGDRPDLRMERDERSRARRQRPRR
ncbi:MAG: hypothetical protein AAF805_00770 [Planctomycetota bacterium]